MKRYYNSDEQYGDAGPFEANSREGLADGMQPTFEAWAEEAYLHDCDRARELGEPEPNRNGYIEQAISEMRIGFINALEAENNNPEIIPCPNCGRPTHRTSLRKSPREWMNGGSCCSECYDSVEDDCY